MTDTDNAYLIRKSGAWYRPDCAGYTVEVVAAGLYSKEKAERECEGEPSMSVYKLTDVIGNIDNGTVMSGLLAERDALRAEVERLTKWQQERLTGESE